MKLVRIFPIGAHRIGNSCLTLQFDANLDKFDTTYVICALGAQRLENLFHKYSIDTSKFEFVDEYQLQQDHPSLAHWHLPGDGRGSWLRQQAIKLLMLDQLDADILFIQDADAFCTRPYSCLNTDGGLNLWCLPNTKHAREYYEAVVNITGRPRQTQHSFVCDMMPVFKQDWIELRERIEQQCSDPWLESVINLTPWDYLQNIKWFSEYELLGNWIMGQHTRYSLKPQRRYEFKTLAHLTHHDFPQEFDCMVDKNPYGGILPFDYSRDEVLNYDAVWDRLQHIKPSF